MPLPITLINNTNAIIAIDDLGITLASGVGVSVDITGFYLPAEVRQSDNLAEFVISSGTVSISVSEGILSIPDAIRFFAGSLVSEEIFTAGGIDLRAITKIVSGDNIVVSSGGDVNNPIFTVATAPSVVAKAIVGNDFVTVTSGVNSIILATDNTNPAFTEFITAQSPAIVGSGIITVTSGISTITVAADAADQDVHHFSFEIIASGIEKEVPFTHQMALHGDLVVESTGSLLVEGTVVLEI